MGKKVVIVGGVAGGASAAARLRRLDEQAEIIMFERDAHISFANCGLPYYIGETIQERSKLMVTSPEQMRTRFRIDVRTHSEVVKVDPARRVVHVRSADRGMYEESYDRLILSPGAKPIRPNIPGIDSERIFTLRNIPDTDRIKAYVDRAQAKSAVIIGGGFIGVEMAENLRLRKLDVSLVEAAPHILAPFDSDMATYGEKALADHGVKLMLGDGVTAFREQNDAIAVELQSGRVIAADMVILAIGVMPSTAFLQGSGIELGPRGHIAVDAGMQTNIDGVYAVGDAVETIDFVTKGKTMIPLAGPANKQGRIAADRIAGLDTTYPGTQGTAIVQIFDLVGASTGYNERMLQRAGLDYHIAHIHPNSHAGYYPGAKPIALKILFDRAGKLLGAQAFGTDGVDKRMDVLATVMRLGGTVHDLTELELAYAPPFSSAKDPVNMAGYVAENVLTGKTAVITAEEIGKLNPDEAQLIDVRSPAEFDSGFIPGAVNIPVDEIRERLDEIDRSKQTVLYCAVGLRGYTASRILSQHGITARNLTGGYRTYSMSHYRPE